MILLRSFIPQLKAKDTVRKTFAPVFRISYRSPDTELNAIELRPPNMDESGKTKYPVLFFL